MSATDFQSRLAARVESVGIAVSGDLAIRLRVYAELLERWNQRINLTGLPLDGWPDQTLDRLIIEPLLAVPLVSGLSGAWVDLGSGGGSPALPLAVSVEGFRLTLTESRGKKAAFLREAVRTLELRHAGVEGRFEDLMGWPARSVRLITCRAVKLSDTTRLANHLLAEDGRMLFFGETLRAPHGLRLLDLKPLAAIGTTIATIAR